MKRGLILFLLALLTINFVFAYSVNVSNVSIKTTYGSGELISGNFNLNLTDALTNLYFSSQFGDVPLRDFLKANGQPLSCEGVDCADLISTSGNGATTKTINLVNNQTQNFAFAITENSISSFNQLKINLSTGFPESGVVPLEIKIANGLNLKYTQFSNNFDRQVSYGCYNKNLSNYDETRKIDSTGFCERVELKESKKYKFGAEVSGSGSARNFEFQLKDSATSQIIAKCNISKSSTDVVQFSDDFSCVAETANLNPSGNYTLCLKDITSGTIQADQNYKIRSESQGNNCGYYGNTGSNSTLDYSVYAKLPKYASAGSINFNLNSSDGTLSYLSSYLATYYSSNCASTCTIPIAIKGIDQSLNVNSVELTYTSPSAGQAAANKIYDVTTTPRKVNFSGNLNLEKFNWTANKFGNQSFNLTLKGDGTKNILNTTLIITSMPLVDSVSPINPPAGVETIFFAQVRSVSNYSNFEWNFGDGSPTVYTNVSYAKHTYKNLSQYNMTIKFGSGVYTNSKTFSINPTNPKDYINSSLEAKRAKVNHANSDISALPSWYKTYIASQVKIDYYQSELNKIESSKVTASTDQDYLAVAASLSNLIVPWAIVNSEKRSGTLAGDYSSFDPSVVQQIFPSSTEDNLAVYKPAILNWMLQNTKTTYVMSKLKLLNEQEQFQDLILVYDVSIQSNSDQESYFVIQKDFSQINVKDSIVEVRKIGNSSYVLVKPRESVAFSFYVTGSQEPVMYVSPKLSVLPTNTEVGVCNFDLVCQKSEGETYKTCRSDCAPVVWTWVWLILFLVLALIAYSILQVWYKRKYEEYLFRDREEMFNLISFIENARANKLSNVQIKEVLLTKGWDRDQVEYAILRSEGKNPGMFEIIPVDKVISRIEMKKKVSKVEDKKPVAPLNPSPVKPGTQRPAFSPFNYNRQGPVSPQNTLNNQNKNNVTGFGQQNKPKA